jgi:hypothetical protein
MNRSRLCDHVVVLGTDVVDAFPEPGHARRRRRLVGATVAALLALGTVLLVVRGAGGRSSVDRGGHGSRPFVAPPVHVIAIALANSPRPDGERTILQRVPEGQSASVRAELAFEPGRSGRVQDATLLIAEPGTHARVGGQGVVDSDYEPVELARGPLTSVASPMTATLTVTIPRSLAPGAYPVFWIYEAVGDPPEQGGSYDPAVVSGQLGVVAVE